MSTAIVQLNKANIFQNKQLILSDVSIEVQQGEFVFLIGKTGTGKSSLIKTLYADIPLQAGTGSIVDYALDGIRQKDIPYLRRKLGVVFQDFKLLPDRSIFDNLKFVLKATGWKDKSTIAARITEVLNEVGMHGIEQKLHDIRHSGKITVTSYNHTSQFNNSCVDMMQASGTAGNMRKVMQQLQKTQDVDRVTFIPAPLRDHGCC